MLSSTPSFSSPTAGRNPSSRHGMCLPPLSAAGYLTPFILTHAILFDFQPLTFWCRRLVFWLGKRARARGGITTCTLRPAWAYTEPHRDEELPQESCSINNLPRRDP